MRAGDREPVFNEVAAGAKPAPLRAERPAEVASVPGGRDLVHTTVGPTGAVEERDIAVVCIV